MDPKGIGVLIDTNPFPLAPPLNHIQDDMHEDNIYDQQGIVDFDAPICKVENDQHQEPIAPPIVQPQRSTRD